MVLSNSPSPNHSSSRFWPRVRTTALSVGTDSSSKVYKPIYLDHRRSGLVLERGEPLTFLACLMGPEMGIEKNSPPTWMDVFNEMPPHFVGYVFWLAMEYKSKHGRYGRSSGNGTRVEQCSTSSSAQRCEVVTSSNGVC
ncbi:hypothetical protein Droror1_Dr00000024 [Drosera rotundifolia]